MKKLKWLYYYIVWKMKLLYKRIMHKNLPVGAKYGNNRFVSGEEANLMIKEKLESGVPFALCRFGMSEFNWVVKCEKDWLWGSDSFKHIEYAVEMFELYSHDEQQGLKKFAETMRWACYNADFIGVWTSIVMGDYYVSTIENIEDKIVGAALAVEPFCYDDPWSEALEGKKVLVISPFVEEIKKQYKENREKLFDDKRVLPKFELLTQKSVWFDAAGKDPRFKTWFEAYDYIFEEAMKKDFDVVLLGCGSFGFPLAARFKIAGKQAIHMGGVLQILFGIIGKRWEKEKRINPLFNRYWIHPEKPQMNLDYKYLDDACYW